MTKDQMRDKAERLLRGPRDDLRPHPEDVQRAIALALLRLGDILSIALDSQEVKG